MPYTVDLSEDAVDDFAGLPAKARRQVGALFDRLKVTPVPPQAKRLRGHTNLYRIRTGNWRVIYAWIPPSQTVTVARIGDRGSVYDDY